MDETRTRDLLRDSKLQRSLVSARLLLAHRERVSVQSKFQVLSPNYGKMITAKRQFLQAYFFANKQRFFSLKLGLYCRHFKYTKRELLRRFYSWEQTAGVDKRWLLRLFAYFPLSIPKCRNFSYRLRSVLRSALFQSGKASYSPPR